MPSARERTRAARALLALPLSALVTCTPRQPSTPPRAHPRADDEATSALPDPTLAPTNRSPGERLELTIPLIDGHGLPLAQLRGRVVVLELTATWVDRWPETYAFYSGLLDEFGPDQLAVVVVALDNERAALSPEPGVRGPGFELGWDPQGALAARLQAAALPTVVVLDRDGVMIHHQGGGPAGATSTLRQHVRAAVSPPAPTTP